MRAVEPRPPAEPSPGCARTRMTVKHRRAPTSTSDGEQVLEEAEHRPAADDRDVEVASNSAPKASRIVRPRTRKPQNVEEVRDARDRHLSSLRWPRTSTTSAWTRVPPGRRRRPSAGCPVRITGTASARGGRRSASGDHGDEQPERARRTATRRRRHGAAMAAATSASRTSCRPAAARRVAAVPRRLADRGRRQVAERRPAPLGGPAIDGGRHTGSG